MAIQTQNPTTGEIVRTFAAFTDSEIEATIARSYQTYKVLRKWSFSERAVCMNKAADILEAEAPELGRILTLEMGKTYQAAQAEVKKCAWVCRHYAEHAEGYMADVPLESNASKTYRKFLPIGPVLAVMPWNFPFWQVFRFVAPALMAGNTGLLKHASNVPQCAMAVEDIIRRAGFPEGAFQTLLITSSKVEQILRDDRVRAATLTGSEPAGSAVASVCGAEIKPVVLELGGSDAFIIMPSADLDKAVKVGTTSRTQNNGQSCVAAKRFIIHADIYDDVKARFKTAFEALKVGDPMHTDTDIGPIVTEGSRKEIVEQVEQALKDGASRVTGAKPLGGDGYFFRPGLLENIPENAPAYREEIFGPVGLLFKVDSLDAAIELANDSPFGLGSAIFTTVKSEAERAIAEIDAGTTFVNSMTSSDPRIPFGGAKRSGIGRELSSEGIHAFCNIKTVSIA